MVLIRSFNADTFSVLALAKHYVAISRKRDAWWVDFRDRVAALQLRLFRSHASAYVPHILADTERDIDFRGSKHNQNYSF
jgi:hypothetical protein